MILYSLYGCTTYVPLYLHYNITTRMPRIVYNNNIMLLTSFLEISVCAFERIIIIIKKKKIFCTCTFELDENRVFLVKLKMYL